MYFKRSVKITSWKERAGAAGAAGNPVLPWQRRAGFHRGQEMQASRGGRDRTCLNYNQVRWLQEGCGAREEEHKTSPSRGLVLTQNQTSEFRCCAQGVAVQPSPMLPFPSNSSFPDRLVHASPSVTAHLAWCCRQGAASGDGEREPGMCLRPVSGIEMSQPDAEQPAESKHHTFQPEW